MKFLVDNQLPSALAHFLASRGVGCQHVFDLNAGGASDPQIWEHASRINCVMISKDEDFSTSLTLASGIAARRIEAGLEAADRIIGVR